MTSPCDVVFIKLPSHIKNLVSIISMFINESTPKTFYFLNKMLSGKKKTFYEYTKVNNLPWVVPTHQLYSTTPLSVS